MYISVQEAAEILKKKEPVIIFDAENENEGDVVFPADIINTDIIKFMMNKCKGIICQTLEERIIKEKQIPIFKKSGKTTTGQTNFVYPVDHVNSHSGISCIDRVMVIKAVLDPASSIDDFVIPGHQNLLKISPNGVLDRQGHTESSSDLVHLAGYSKSAVICEIIDDDGIPMDGQAVMNFSKKFDIPVVLLSDIHKHFIHENNIIITPFLSFEKNPYAHLHDKTCVLSGGSSGIGKAIKELLQKHNCNVIDLSRSSDTKCDITNLESIKQSIKKTQTIDYVINCAGHINVKHIKESTFEEWKQHFDVNIFAPFNILKVCIPLLTDTGTIVNVCSPSAYKTRSGWSAYCASKAALSSFTNNLAEEMNTDTESVKVFGVSPSKTDTPMIHQVFPDIHDDMLMNPKDIALLTINILSKRDHIENGQIFNIKKELNSGN